ncbi:MAG: trypsin-like peptidase domain-containing protein [Planctomycetota bacterium]|jgi:serine protease Do|nr:trypsin-like peptidase domain-containing protein [Planctomycetota bacterium]
MTRILPLLCLTLAVSAADLDTTLDARIAEQRQVADLLQRSYIFVADGSGVLIDPAGWIMSNHHVTGGAWEHRVRLASGRSYQAKVVGTDPFGDISLLKITNADLDPLPYVPLGRAEDLQLGMPVLAIGNPFGLGDSDDTPTISFGSLGSGRIVRGVYTDAIQIDAAVNPGNSGGPALSRDGRLLGINGQIRTRTGMRINSGVGLAIACTQLQAFLPHLRSTPSGYVHHTAMPKGLELEQKDGHISVVTWRGAPATADLLSPGDRLLLIAKRAVTSEDTAIGLFASLPWTGPDTTIPVTVQTPGSAPRSIDLPAGRTPIAGKAWHGLKVTTRPARGDEPARLVVQSVDPGSPAAEAGIAPGWVLLKANGRSLTRRIDLLKALVPVGIGDELRITGEARDGSPAEAAFYLRPAH